VIRRSSRKLILNEKTNRSGSCVGQIFGLRNLKGSDYALTIFTAKEIASLLIFERKGKPYVQCAASNKPRPAKPEEIVRQLYLRKLIDE
jgi:hypothetical protein